MQEIKQKQILRSFLGKPFALGDSSRGFDCFFMCYYYLYLLGNKLPKEWNGISLNNYKEIRKEDAVKSRNLMFDFMKEYTDVVTNGIRFGDILKLKPTFDSSKPSFLGIYNGNGDIMAVFVKKGIGITKMSSYSVLDIYRSRK